MSFETLRLTPLWWTACVARLLALVLALASFASISVAQTSGVSAKPNIVVIYADDLGYGDVQCYNPQRGKTATPNIDRFASQGMRFTDGHSSSGVCSPSRYAPFAKPSPASWRCPKTTESNETSTDSSSWRV